MDRDNMDPQTDAPAHTCSDFVPRRPSERRVAMLTADGQRAAGHYLLTDAAMRALAGEVAQ